MTSSTNRIGIVGAVLLVIVASSTACRIIDLTGFCFTLSDTGCPSDGSSSGTSYIYHQVIINPGGVLAPRTVTTTVRPTPAQQPAVVWLNRDSLAHHLVSDTPLFETGDIVPGAGAQISVSQSGTFSYHCVRHPTMVGTIIVP